MISVRRWIQTAAALLAISLLLHFPRLFFITDLLSRERNRFGLEDFPKLCRWDCPYYQYFSHGGPDSVEVAFFPFFAGIQGLFASLGSQLPASLISILTGNLASWVAVASLILLGRGLWAPTRNSNALQTPLILGLAVAFYPHSQYFSYGYPEPLFALLYGCAILFVAKDRLLEASLLLGLSAITRPQGIWLAGIFGACLPFLKGVRAKDLLKLIPHYLLLGLPFLIFMAWQHERFGTPVAFLRALSHWDRKFEPLNLFRVHFTAHWASSERILSLLSILAAYRFWKRPEFRWKWLAIATLVLAELPLCYGTWSYLRYSSINLGLFIYVAEILAARPWALIAYVVWALTQLSVQTRLWLTSESFLF